jgi:membrane-bound ClpP family serine protease
MSENKKPRGKPFQSHDTRRNRRGQRNAAAVATAAEIRALYIEVLHEMEHAPDTPGRVMSNLERVVRRHVALAGDERAREQMLDRIFGKAPDFEPS